MSNIASVVLKHEDVARGSMARAAIELANATALLALNDVFSLPAVAIATTATKAKTVATLNFSIGGQLYTKGATDNFWVLGAAGAATVVAANSFQKYLLCITSGGVEAVYEGTQASTALGVTWTNISALGPYAPLLTVLNAGNAIACTATVATDGTHTFTPGTTAFNATGITTTFADGCDPSLMPVLASATGLVVGQSV